MDKAPVFGLKKDRKPGIAGSNPAWPANRVVCRKIHKFFKNLNFWLFEFRLLCD